MSATGRYANRLPVWWHSIWNLVWVVPVALLYLPIVFLRRRILALRCGIGVRVDGLQQKRQHPAAFGKRRSVADGLRSHFRQLLAESFILRFQMSNALLLWQVRQMNVLLTTDQPARPGFRFMLFVAHTLDLLVVPRRK